MATIYREEHPRPNFIRPDWLSLNGCWDFEIADDSPRNFSSYLDGSPYKGTIEVPFAPQAPLSGIGRNENLKSVWYRRSFFLDEKTRSATVLLNFGAVDYRAEVYVNGKPAGTHIGGYTPFTIDITALVHEGRNILVVNALDNDEDPDVPCGTQGKNGFAHCTGIWQSVWLEFAAKTYLSAYRATPSLSQKAILAQGVIQCPVEGKLEVELFYNNISLGKYKYEQKERFFIRIPIPDALKLWQIGEGGFYDVVLTIRDKNGIPLDTILTYSAFREIAVKEKSILLNGKPLTIKQAVDCRYYPAGHYTAPSEAAVKQDILCALSLGFNSVRIRGTLSEPLYLYYADKLGLLLFEEYPSSDMPLNPKTALLWTSEWTEIMERDFGHPSICFWMPAGSYNGDNCDFVSDICNRCIRADSSRPVIDGEIHYHTAVFDKRLDVVGTEKLLRALYEPQNGPFSSPREAAKAAKKYPGAMSAEALSCLPFFAHSLRLPAEAFESTKNFKRIFAAYVNAVLSAHAAGIGFSALIDNPGDKTGFFTMERDFKFERGCEASVRKFFAQIN